MSEIKARSIEYLGDAMDMHGPNGCCTDCYGRDLAHVIPLGRITPEEWETFTSALAVVAVDGVVSQTDMRPLISSIFHKHRGLCYARARRLGLLEPIGKEHSTDVAGGNGDKEQRIYRWIGAAA